ncbi:MAG: NYN domain-containing protein [Calditrichia bacterium]
MKAVKKILIDGYNVIFKAGSDFGNLPSLEAKRDHLIRLLSSSPALRSRQVLVIFDSRERQPSAGNPSRKNVRVRFSRPGQEADEVIQQLVRKSANPATVRVVSSDRQIQHTARDHGAQVMEALEFWNSLHTPAAPRRNKQQAAEPEISDREVEMWLNFFRKDRDE